MKKVAYYLFSHNGLFTFVKRLLAIVEEKDAATLGLAVFVDMVKRLFSNFDKALKRDMVDPFTVKVGEADQERDNRFLGFKNYVNACRYRKSEAWQQAAEQIGRAIERYGGDLYRMANAEESAAIRNLVSDLNTEPLLTACNTIEAGAWISELTEAQEAFSLLEQQRVSETEANYFTLGETRKPLVAGTRSLLKMIELQQQASNNAELNQLVEQLNNLISQSMASARISHTLNEKEETTN
ncbi:hypothetical protein DMA11_00270 [Marinilabiliaceae bacterium JC017]|nr:hypothetical protein DMA11_00270 [Marinilabiliaceae bacterium JC017]